jgi:hypothetical protein
MEWWRNRLIGLIVFIRVVFILAQECVLFLEVGIFLLTYTVGLLKLATLFIAGSRIMLSVSFFFFFVLFDTSSYGYAAVELMRKCDVMKHDSCG